MQFLHEAIYMWEKFQFTAWVGVASCLVISFAASIVAQQFRSGRGWLLRTFVVLLPFWFYLIWMAATPPAESGTSLGWFLAGLMLLTPFIISWFIGSASGFVWCHLNLKAKG